MGVVGGVSAADMGWTEAGGGGGGDGGVSGISGSGGDSESSRQRATTKAQRPSQLRPASLAATTREDGGSGGGGDDGGGGGGKSASALSGSLSISLIVWLHPAPMHELHTSGGPRGSCPSYNLRRATRDLPLPSDQ